MTKRGWRQPPRERSIGLPRTLNSASQSSKSRPRQCQRRRLRAPRPLRGRVRTGYRQLIFRLACCYGGHDHGCSSAAGESSRPEVLRSAAPSSRSSADPARRSTSRGNSLRRMRKPLAEPAKLPTTGTALLPRLTHLAEKILSTRSAIEGERKQVTVRSPISRGRWIFRKRSIRKSGTGSWTVSSKFSPTASSLRGHGQSGHGRRHHGAFWSADRPRGSRGARLLRGARSAKSISAARK